MISTLYMPGDVRKDVVTKPVQNYKTVKCPICHGEKRIQKIYNCSICQATGEIRVAIKPTNFKEVILSEVVAVELTIVQDTLMNLIAPTVSERIFWKYCDRCRESRDYNYVNYGKVHGSNSKDFIADKKYIHRPQIIPNYALDESVCFKKLDVKLAACHTCLGKSSISYKGEEHFCSRCAGVGRVPCKPIERVVYGTVAAQHITILKNDIHYTYKVKLEGNTLNYVRVSQEILFLSNAK